MRFPYNNLKTKIKRFFKSLPFKRVFLTKADRQHYPLLIDFFRKSRDSENHLAFILENLLNRTGAHQIVYNTALLVFGQISGFVSHSAFLNHYLWGDGLTIDPRFRRLKWGTRLDKVGDEIACKNHLSRFRIAAIFSNRPILKKMGFEDLRSWYIFGYKPKKNKTFDSRLRGVRLATDSDLDRLEQYFLKSEYFALTNQMYVEDLTWYPLDQSWLSDLIKNGKVLLNEDKSGIRGLVVINKKSLINPFPGGSFSIMEIGYFNGECAAILDFIQKNYHPDLLRIYSADGIPLKFLPAEIKNGYFVWFNSLFGGLNRMELSEEKLYFTSVMLMQKIVSIN